MPPPPPPPPGQKQTQPNPVDNARWFFAPGIDARTHKQKELVAQLGQKLKGCDNVIWELANELRVLVDSGHRADNQNHVAWLGQMRDALRSNAGQNINITTSTAILNEGQLLTGLPLTVFDFHSGQWNATGDYTSGIADAKARAASYNPQAPLIINDDGVPDSLRSPVNVKRWASAAFDIGLNFATKAPYPPARDFDDARLIAAKNVRGVRGLEGPT